MSRRRSRIRAISASAAAIASASVWLMQGRPVAALTAEAAAIQTAGTTSTLMYYGRHVCGARIYVERRTTLDDIINNSGG